MLPSRNPAFSDQHNFHPYQAKYDPSLDHYKKNTIAVISVRKRRPPGKPKHQLMQVICKNTDDHNHRKKQQNNNFSARFLAVLFTKKHRCCQSKDRYQDHRDIIQIPADMFSKRIMKNMKFYRPHKEPEYHQTANCSQASARFFMYYMLSQINHPGTVHSQINTATTLICQISHKNIFRSYQPAEIRQQYTYQDSSIRQCPFFIVCHENSSLINTSL